MLEYLRCLPHKMHFISFIKSNAYRITSIHTRAMLIILPLNKLLPFSCIVLTKVLISNRPVSNTYISIPSYHIALGHPRTLRLQRTFKARYLLSIGCFLRSSFDCKPDLESFGGMRHWPKLFSGWAKQCYTSFMNTQASSVAVLLVLHQSV